MTAGVTEHGLRAADVEAVLAGYGFGTERPHSGAVVLALLDPLRIVWANEPAVALFETDDADDLFAQVFAGRGREGLGASVSRLVPDGVPRLERLRLIRGFRSRTLAVALSRTHLPDGRALLILTTPTHEGLGKTQGFARSGLRPPEVPLFEETPSRPPSEGSDAATAAPLPVPLSPPAVAPANENGGSAPVPIHERFEGVRPARLLWQTDPGHRIAKLTGGIPDLAGIDDPDMVGQPLADILVPVDDDPAETLAGALASKAPWSGLRVRWPLSAGEASVAVTLGAVPVMSRLGQFDGFRGFGIVDLLDLVPTPAPAEPVSRPVADDPADGSPAGGAAFDDAAGRAAEGAGEPVVPVGAEPPVEPEMTAGPLPPDEPPAPDTVEIPEPAPATDAAPDRPYAFSSKVVALRPYQTFAPAAPKASDPPGAISPTGALDEGPAAEDATADALAVEQPDLTSSERSNFQAIGRALLGAENEGGAPVGAGGVPAGRNALGVIERLGLGVLVAGEGRLLYANPSFHALSGYPTLDAVQAAGGLAHLLGGLDPHAVSDRGADRAFSLVGLGGSVTPVQGRLQATEWDGAPARLLSIRPETDRIAQIQMLEGEIKRREHEAAELRAMLDSVADSILTVDRRGRILTLNDAATQLFGHAERDVAGEPLAMLIGPDAQVAVVDLDSDPEERRGGMDVPGRTATGRVLSLRVTWQPLGDGRSCVVLRDQGERSALQRDLAKANEKVDEALASRPDFLGKISHEVRTPLNAILGFAEVILDERFGPLGNERYRAYLRDIHASGTEVLDLVNNLLDLSTMEAGLADMRPAPLDVNRVIAECVGEVQPTAHRERVIVRLSLVPHLAAALIDERAFRQIMGHVLSNAIRFNEPGGQIIVSSAVNDAGAVAVRVRDTGIGMTDAEIASAMEPFTLSRTAQPGGNGLGLPLAGALVEANGATMTVRSRKDEGTFVEIVLPTSPPEPMRRPA